MKADDNVWTKEDFSPVGKKYTWAQKIQYGHNKSSKHPIIRKVSAERRRTAPRKVREKEAKMLSHFTFEGCNVVFLGSVYDHFDWRRGSDH